MDGWAEMGGREDEELIPRAAAASEEERGVMGGCACSISTCTHKTFIRGPGRKEKERQEDERGQEDPKDNSHRNSFHPIPNQERRTQNLQPSTQTWTPRPSTQF